jgi:CRISPR-associated protein (TIGR02584 family)
MPDKNSPESYERRILVAVSGLSPQILTETIYGLISSEEPFIPTEIHLVSTVEGANRAELSLLHPQTGQFHALCREYSLTGVQFDHEMIHVLSDQEGSRIEDIRTPEQNEIAADYITKFISSLSNDENCSIHASIAGGRKTMGYYLGYALSLYGRPQDRLSHVLVSSGYEGNAQFFFPTQKSTVITSRDGRPLDTSKAKVMLAEIPFIRLREDVPSKLMEGEIGFSKTIEIAQKLRQPIELVIDIENKAILASTMAVSLPDTLFAFYLWVLDETLIQECSLVKPNEYEPNREYAESFITFYQKVCGEMRDTDKTIKALAKGMDSCFFTEKVSRIGKEFENQLNKQVAGSYKIKGSGARGRKVYSTDLNIEQLKFERAVSE